MAAVAQVHKSLGINAIVPEHQDSPDSMIADSLNGAIPQLVNAGVVITFFAPSNPAMTAFDAALAGARPQLSDVETT